MLEMVNGELDPFDGFYTEDDVSEPLGGSYYNGEHLSGICGSCQATLEVNDELKDCMECGEVYGPCCASWQVETCRKCAAKAEEEEF